MQTPDRRKCPFNKVSLFQGLNCMQELFLEERKGVLIREVSSFRGVLRYSVLIMQSHTHSTSHAPSFTGVNRRPGGADSKTQEKD